MNSQSGAELERFIDRFQPQIADQARSAFKLLRARLPGAVVLVYDNYNALAIGFGPNEKTRAIALSIAVYPRWVSLFLAGGPFLEDPEGLLKGSGSTVRHVVLNRAEDLLDPRIAALIDQAVQRCEPPIADAPPGQIVVKAIAAKQRPRQPQSGPSG